MSVGEIVNLYKNRELIINPAFQRLFRWDETQKSRFIESLLLRIPIPPIFVFETDDGVWELIDGLQRVSTILEFLGELRDPDTGRKLPQLKLVGTRYLPSLDGVRYLYANPKYSLPSAYQISIKRGRLGVQILEKKSDPQSKFDLFQRLNSGGSIANPQELRNCILVMINEEFFDFVKGLSIDKSFLSVVNVNPAGKKTQRDVEFVIRFLVHLYIEYDGKMDIQEYLDNGAIDLASDAPADWPEIETNFRETFALLESACGKNALRKYNDGKFRGRVGLVAFETIAIGVASNLPSVKKKRDPSAYLGKKIKELWGQPAMIEFMAAGLRGTDRIQKTIPFGQSWFE